MSSKTKSTAMKEEVKPARVPKLRFPEFRNADGWSEGRVADIAVSESSSRALNKLALKSEGFPVYGADSCVGFIDSFDQADDYIAIVKDGSGVGRLALKRGESSILGTLAYIKCKPGSETLLTWLYYCLSSLDLRQFIKGSGIPHIYFSDYATHGVLIPPPLEQQKIAECLSSVDELMTAQARKVVALKTHKKGLMQQLFPREGETQPSLRFPEFQTAGEWNEEKLDDLVHLQDGFAFKSTDFVKTQENATQVIRITDINNQNTNAEKVYIPNSFLEANKLAKYDVNDGDLLLSLTGAAGFNFFFWNGGPATINQRTAKVTSKKKSGHDLLLLLEPLIHEKINARGEGQNNNLSKEFLNTIVLRVPEPAEQHRLASCLSSLDALITAETQKLEALKAYKKGLMQQLFPSPEGVEA